jgi:zinc finger protein 830
MADVRALLKAKRQEARVNHHLASYTTTGQLRCSVCSTNIKHASAWDGHLGSKAHRMNVARAKEEEKAREQQQVVQEAQSSKRKADEDASGDDLAKKRKTEPAGSAPRSGTFPSDFFSDPSNAPPPPSYDSDDDEVDSLPSAPAPVPERHVAFGKSELDQEWIKFQHAVINAPDAREAYDRATVFAEPNLVSDTAEGFPPLQGEESPEAEGKLDPEQERRRKEQDERELIMDRLLDEERAQEEADMKVSVLKSRLEALRTKREVGRTKSKVAV